MTWDAFSSCNHFDTSDSDNRSIWFEEFKSMANEDSANKDSSSLVSDSLRNILHMRDATCYH